MGLLTRLPIACQGTHETVESILVDELEEDTLVVIVQGPNDRVVGNLPTEGEHAVDLPLPA